MEFISVDSSVYYCLLFPDLPLLIPDGTLVWPQAACARLQVIYSRWLSPSDLACPLCSALPTFHQPRAWNNLFNDLRLLPVCSPSASRGGLWNNLEGDNPGHPQQAPFSVQERRWEYFSALSPHVFVKDLLRAFSSFPCRNVPSMGLTDMQSL